jgi:hypothetical protein
MKFLLNINKKWAVSSEPGILPTDLDSYRDCLLNKKFEIKQSWNEIAYLPTAGRVLINGRDQ